MWAKRPDESRQAYRAFLYYRDLGPGRSVDRAYREARGARESQSPPLFEGGTISIEEKRAQRRGRITAPGHWFRWVRTFNWEERAAAYDAELDRRKMAAQATRDAELIDQRMRCEGEWHTLLYDAVQKVYAVLMKNLDLPPVDTIHCKLDQDGNVVGRETQRGLNPSEHKRLGEVLLEMMAVTVHGHARLSRTVKIPEEACTGYGTDPQKTTTRAPEFILSLPEKPEESS